MSRWLLAVVLFVIGLWLNTRSNQFPYYYHPDESKKVRQVLSDERNFNHPLLLLSAAELVWKAAGKPPGNQQVVELGRWISAVFCSLGTVFFALAAWSWRGMLAEVVTGVLLLLNHQVFELAHYMKEDTALYLGVGLTAWMLVLFSRKPGWQTALALGAAVGVAFSGKYLGLILLAPALGLIWFGAGSEKGTQTAWLLLGVVVIFTALNFRLFTDLATFQQSFSKEMDWAVQGQKELTRSVPHAIYLNIFVSNSTPVIWLLMLAFLTNLWRRRRGAGPLAWLLAGTFFGWLLVLSFSPKTNDRYFLPLTGLAYLLAGAGAVYTWQILAKKKPVWCVAFAALLLLGGVWDGWRTVHFAQAFAKDDRAELVAWIEKNIPATATIAYDSRVNLPDDEVYHDLAHPLPHRLLRENFAADIGNRDELLHKGVSFVIITESTYGRFFLDSLRPKEGQRDEYERRAAFYRDLKTRPPLWKSERGDVLYLHPGLEVYALAR